MFYAYLVDKPSPEEAVYYRETGRDDQLLTCRYSLCITYCCAMWGLFLNVAS